MFRFSAEAADALAELDPREAVTVDFRFAGRDGDSVRRGLWRLATSPQDGRSCAP